jgi:hypothetical protein
MMNLSSLSDHQLLQMAAQQGIKVQSAPQAATPSPTQNLSSLSDDQLLAMAKQQGINVQPKTTSSGVMGSLENFGKGVVNAGQSFLNDISPIIPGGQLAQQMPQVTGSGIPYTAGQVAGNLGTFIGGGAEVDAGRAALEGAPVVGKFASMLGGNGLSGVARRAIGSAGYGAVTNPNNRVQGAIGGAVLSPVADAGGAVLNKTVISPIANLVSKTAPLRSVLSYIQNAANKGVALSPEQTADNISMNYMDSNGNMLPVDIGTATNNAKYAAKYQDLKSVPFSGAAEKANQVAMGQAQKNVADLQGQVAGAQTQANTATQAADALHQQLTNQDPAETLAYLNDQLNKTNSAINNAPTVLNSLGRQAGDPAKINELTADSLQKSYQAEKEQAEENYEPINNSTIDLNATSTRNAFPNYQKAAKALLGQRDNLTDLFDSSGTGSGASADLGTALNSELNKAESFLYGDKDNDIPAGKFYDATVPNMVQRVQTLGKLAANAASQGRRNEARLLNDLGQGLNQDIVNGLNRSGNGNLATQLQNANAHYRDNVVPFWANNVIRKTVDNDYEPQGDELANALHDSNNSPVFNKLPDNLKNANLFQLINAGKNTTSKGVSTLTPSEIGNKYQNGIKTMPKQTISSYNPDVDEYFENIPNLINRKADLENQIQAVQKNVKGANKAYSTTTNTAQTQAQNLAQTQAQLAAAKKSLYTAPQTAPATINTNGLMQRQSLPHAALDFVRHAGMIPTGRIRANALTNPMLINAYMNRGVIPMDAREMLLRGAYPLTAKAVIANTINGGNQ